MLHTADAEMIHALLNGFMVMGDLGIVVLVSCAIIVSVDWIVRKLKHNWGADHGSDAN